MGHRASVAYVRPDGTIQAHYSHWGALELGLVDDLTPTTPLGTMKEPRFMEQIRGASEEMEERQDGISVAFATHGDAVDRKPYGAYSSLEEWAAEGVDYLFHEAAYVVHVEPWDVTGYEPVRFLPDDSNNSGLLIEIDPTQWGDFRNLPYEWDDGEEIPFDEFERRIHSAATEAGCEIPDWSRDALRSNQP